MYQIETTLTFWKLAAHVMNQSYFTIKFIQQYQFLINTFYIW